MSIYLFSFLKKLLQWVLSMLFIKGKYNSTVVYFCFCGCQQDDVDDTFPSFFFFALLGFFISFLFPFIATLRIYILQAFHHHHHHHLVPLAWISLTLSHHFSLSFIASGRSSGIHSVFSHSCCMYVLAGRSAFARPYVGVHRSTSLMN